MEGSECTACGGHGQAASPGGSPATAQDLPTVKAGVTRPERRTLVDAPNQLSKETARIFGI